MLRIAFAAMVLLSVASVGCHRGIRAGGLLGHRFHAHRAGCHSCGDHSEVAQAGYEVHSDCGCDVNGAGCNRCNGERVRFRDSVGSPLVHRIANGLSCGSGCGEVYWGEWISTPPKPDPCDSCGNYTGVPNSKMYRPHRQPVRTLLRSVAGVRYGSPCESCGSADPCGCDTGCNDCETSPTGDCGCGSDHGVPVPNVQPQPNKTVPSPQPRADQPIQKTSYHTSASHAGCSSCQ